MSMYIGEALVGDGNEIAHIDLLIGDKNGPVGVDFANALAGQDGIYSVQLLAKVQMLHFLGIRYVAPSAPGDCQPALPCRGVRDERRPVEVNQNMAAKIRRSRERTLRGD